MAFKNTVMKLRRALLCCSKRDQKLSLEIGSPTNVRRVDISESLSGLPDAGRKYIREMASSDAIHLLGLHSQPPSQATTSPSSPTESPTESPSRSRLSSREPSVALLNAASTNLPSTIPTPPDQRHKESSPPAARMINMWKHSNRSSTDGGELYEKLERVKDEQKGPNESSRTLNLECDWEYKKGSPESLYTLNLSEGFETQDTMGGHAEENEMSPMIVNTPTSIKKTKVVPRSTTPTTFADNTDSEVDSFVAAESSPLVKV